MLRLVYYIQERQEYNIGWANTEAEIIAWKGVQESYSVDSLANYTAVQEAQFVGWGYTGVPEAVSEGFWHYVGPGMGWPECGVGYCVAPGETYTQLLDHIEATWTETWEWNGVFVRYFKRYYTQWVEFPEAPIILPVVEPSIPISNNPSTLHVESLLGHMSLGGIRLAKKRIA